MKLSWNEIRLRAAEFSRQYAYAHYEKGQTQSFYIDFFRIFGVKAGQVAARAIEFWNWTGRCSFDRSCRPVVVIGDHDGRLHGEATEELARRGGGFGCT